AIWKRSAPAVWNRMQRHVINLPVISLLISSAGLSTVQLQLGRSALPRESGGGRDAIQSSSVPLFSVFLSEPPPFGYFEKIFSARPRPFRPRAALPSYHLSILARPKIRNTSAMASAKRFFMALPELTVCACSDAPRPSPLKELTPASARSEKN